MTGHTFWLTVALVVLATWRITRLIIRDDFPPVAHLRDRILARWPTEANRYYASEVDDPTAEITAIRIPRRRRWRLPASRIVLYEQAITVAINDGHPYGTDDDTGETILFGDQHPTWSPVESTAIGTLITCVYCAGFWISVIAVLTVWAATPAGTLPAVGWWAAPWALSAVVVAVDNVIDG